MGNNFMTQSTIDRELIDPTEDMICSVVEFCLTSLLLALITPSTAKDISPSLKNHNVASVVTVLMAAEFWNLTGWRMLRMLERTQSLILSMISGLLMECLDTTINGLLKLLTKSPESLTKEENTLPNILPILSENKLSLIAYLLFPNTAILKTTALLTPFVANWEWKKSVLNDPNPTWIHYSLTNFIKTSINRLPIILFWNVRF